MKKNTIIMFMLAACVFSASAQLIKQGNVLEWSTSAGQNGTLTIVSVNGPVFEADQVNNNNRAAGTVRLYGALIENGSKMVLINNGQWKGVMEGNVSPSQISGTLTEGRSTYSFTITGRTPPPPARREAPPAPARRDDPPPPRRDAPAAVSTAPFTQGANLPWTTNASGGQNGTMRVTSVRGNTFTLEQTNNKNRAAGVTKLEGEIKNGKVYIYNRQWNETWEGTIRGNRVSGKINNSYTFTIN